MATKRLTIKELTKQLLTLKIDYEECWRYKERLQTDGLPGSQDYSSYEEDFHDILTRACEDEDNTYTIYINCIQDLENRKAYIEWCTKRELEASMLCEFYEEEEKEVLMYGSDVDLEHIKGIIRVEYDKYTVALHALKDARS